jgi:hypothetical protein
MDFHRMYSEDDGIRMGREAGSPDEHGAGDLAFDCRVSRWTIEAGEERAAWSDIYLHTAG